MSLSFPLRRQSGPPYLQIVDAIERRIGDGSLAPGDRLPTQRELAAQLHVDLTTVSRAYSLCKRRGLIDARGVRGSFVAHPQLPLDHVLDLSLNLPPPPAGIDIGEQLRTGMAKLLARSDAGTLMTYHLGGGSDADLQAAARWLAPALGEVRADSLVVCSGAQNALAALVLALTKAGDAVLSGTLVYPGLPHMLGQFGRRIRPLECDEQGLLPDALERQLHRSRARLLYLNPTAHNPTARTMPEARRRELLRVAGHHRVTIIEDDPYWRLSADPPPPLAALAPERVCHVATLSKCISPGLRTAFVRLPPQVAREDVLSALRAMQLTQAPLLNALATQWILDGSAQALCAGVGEEASARLSLVKTRLQGAYDAPADGIHVWYRLPGHWNMARLLVTARAQGLHLAPAEAFRADPSLKPENALRISIGAIAERRELELTLSRLDRLIRADA